MNDRISAGRVVRAAHRFQASNPEHLDKVADIIIKGGVVAFPFNGVFGLLGDVDNPAAAEQIHVAKGRPLDKKLITIADPTVIHEIGDLDRVPFDLNGLEPMLRRIHALGIIFPAAKTAPQHLVDSEKGTIVVIWTQYEPLIQLDQRLRARGVRAMVGTSANLKDQPTHIEAKGLWNDFSTTIDGIVEANFDHLKDKPYRLKSTSMLDFTDIRPRLHRSGNVSVKEIEEALREHNFPELYIPRDVIQVHGREITAQVPVITAEDPTPKSWFERIFGKLHLTQ